ncbi:hypothetical protein BJ165DRAFT_1534420 [Panaeolus papilionaceus]|nr:hypothetical protein BJ165DRAFT_1534420 [Panaeolus papilionaceus]
MVAPGMDGMDYVDLPSPMSPDPWKQKHPHFLLISKTKTPTVTPTTRNISDMSTTSKLSRCSFLPNTSALMGPWSFNGTLDDVSPNHLGPAVIVAGNSGTALAFETQWPTNVEPNSKGFIEVRTPGWINIPNLLFMQNQSFTMAFSLCLSQAFTTRQTLLGNWTSGTAGPGRTEKPPLNA